MATEAVAVRARQAGAALCVGVWCCHRPAGAWQLGPGRLEQHSALECGAAIVQLVHEAAMHVMRASSPPAALA